MATTRRKMIVFPSKKELSEAMAEYTAKLSAKFCKQKGLFTVVLSGGDLIDWLCKLVKPPYIGSIEWSKWHVFWVDERVCSWEDPDSNYKLAMDGFLSKVPIPHKNIYAIDKNSATDGDAEHCAMLYEECLKNLVKENIIPISPKTGYPQFDLQLLGMGPDGHMASLFPGHPQINVKDKWVTHITDSPKQPPKRITFTLPVINSALYNLMAVCDKEQAHAVAEIMKENKPLPSAHLSAQVENVWYLDQAAASML
uniref:Probable 6-phosphogluconolactonase n=1 Tax=Noccaea caerulescens TaxID=107243 RepID=A0A1J3EZZ4_NOCCA